MKAPSGHTQVFAVLGHPIGHTLSPVMHNAAFEALGMDAVYLAFDVAPEYCADVLTGMGHMGFGGVNLTVPLKETAFRALEELDESARLLGAVNTVVFREGQPTGWNTDGYGFLLAIEEAFGEGLAGRRLFVLGAGGAGRAVALRAARGGAAGVAVTDADAARAERVAREIQHLGAGCEAEAVPVTERREAARAADLIVQATPLGMNPDDPVLLEAEVFRPGVWLFDLVYMYRETPQMRAARTGGARAANGLGMLLHQGARAFTIWTGRDAPLAVMRQALEQAVYAS